MPEANRLTGLRACLAVAVILGTVGTMAVRGVEVSAPNKAAHARPARVSAMSATKIIGGTAAQHSLLRAILAALPPTRVPLLRVVGVHGGVKLKAPGDAIRTTWKVAVTGVVFADRSADLHLPPVLEVDVGPVGWPTTDAGPRPGHATPATIAATRRTMRRLARASGARVSELRVSAPDALAVVLRVRVSDAASFLEHRLKALVIAAASRDTRSEGLYIEVDDARGMAWASAETRLGGESYVRPRLSGCNPFPPPGPAPGTYPPCHA